MFKSILLIDDSEVDLFVNGKIIEMAQISRQIVTFSKPVRALEYLEKIKNGTSIGAMPDLILLDLNMPVINGFEFLDIYEKKYADHAYPAKVVVLSALLDPADAERARSYSSVLRFLNKPLTIESLDTLLIFQGLNAARSLSA
jgi:CheY-like chemotaxis protein